MIIDGYRDFAYKMGLIESNIEDSEIIIASINSWTSQNRKWLFIFDNAETLEQIYDYLPINPQGHIIITSRNMNWNEFGEVLEIDVFSEVEAPVFMRKRTNLQDESGLDTLLAALGHLPLALEQASAYIINNCISYDEYKDLFDEFRIEILKKYPPLKYNYSVATTWIISVEKIYDESSRQLLDILAFLYADSVDIQFFTTLSEHLGAPLSEKVNNVLEFNDIIYRLKEYSLIKYSSNIISIHRLLQEVIQMSTDSKKWISFLVNLVYDHLDYDFENKKSWMTYKDMVDQIYSIANHGNRHKIEIGKVSFLYHQLGSFFNLVLNDFIRAESMYLEALKIREEVLGIYSKETIITKNNLAGLYRDQGRYAEAEELYLSSIPICEAVFGGKSKLLLTLKDNLAQLYQTLGEYEKARKLYIEVIDIKTSFYKSESPFVATSMGNFAVLLTELGEFEQAESLLVELLEIKGNINGTQNEQIASILDALANVYTKLGSYDLAEKYFKDSLYIRSNIFTSEHSDVAISLNNLATLYMEMHRFDEAEPLLYKALDISERIISIDPCEIATTYNNLGMVLSRTGKYETAKKMLEKSINLRKKHLEEEHIDFSASYSNLGDLYMSLEEYDLAEPFFKDALKIRKKILGIKHPETIDSVNNLGLLYNAQMKFDKAEPLLVQALDSAIEVFGDENKDTIESYYSLSVFYLQTKRTKKGIELLSKAITLSRKVLGEKHGTTIMIDDYIRNSVLPHAKLVF
ncbi:tetratricopeptide repeat protein [Brevibacillus reuszeri]|uniref:tetratricopeptide repeat protein n=1 Tax=Brevibacillus reuszeri TaxID=54915 RepID=UPI003D1F0192